MSWTVDTVSLIFRMNHNSSQALQTSAIGAETSTAPHSPPKSAPPPARPCAAHRGPCCLSASHRSPRSRPACRACRPERRRLKPGRSVRGRTGLAACSALRCRRDRRMLALQQRIFSAHRSLKFRKLADNLGRQIGLGEHARAAPGKRWLARQTIRRKAPPTNGAMRSYALALRPELCVESHAEMVEAGHALIERLLQIEAELFRRSFQQVEVGQVGLIGIPEIQRIGKPGAHDLAVAMRDLASAVLRLDVGGEDEAVGERRDAPLPLVGEIRGRIRVALRQRSAYWRCLLRHRPYRSADISPSRGRWRRRQNTSGWRGWSAG